MMQDAVMKTLMKVVDRIVTDVRESNTSPDELAPMVRDVLRIYPGTLDPREVIEGALGRKGRKVK